MDPIQGLVTAVMGILMSYLTKGAEEFVKAAGEVAFKKAKTLFDTLKARLAGDKEATDNLAHFEEKPDRYKPVVEDILQERLAQDSDLVSELKNLLKEMGPELEIIQKMKVGEGVIGLEASEMTSGKAKVIQEMDEAKNVIGGKVDRIG